MTVSDICKFSTSTTLTATAVTALASFAGHSVELLHGAGFGLIQGLVQTTLTSLNEKYKKVSTSLMPFIATAIGGSAAFGLSHAAAAAGLVAAPISVPLAAVLTVANFAIPILLKQLMVKINTSKVSTQNDVPIQVNKQVRVESN